MIQTNPTQVAYLLQATTRQVNELTNLNFVWKEVSINIAFPGVILIRQHFESVETDLQFLLSNLVELIFNLWHNWSESSDCKIYGGTRDVWIAFQARKYLCLHDSKLLCVVWRTEVNLFSVFGYNFVSCNVTCFELDKLFAAKVIQISTQCSSDRIGIVESIVCLTLNCVASKRYKILYCCWFCWNSSLIAWIDYIQYKRRTCGWRCFRRGKVVVLNGWNYQNIMRTRIQDIPRKHRNPNRWTSDWC